VDKIIRLPRQLKSFTIHIKYMWHLIYLLCYVTLCNCLWILEIWSKICCLIVNRFKWENVLK